MHYHEIIVQQQEFKIFIFQMQYLFCVRFIDTFDNVAITFSYNESTEMIFQYNLI